MIYVLSGNEREFQLYRIFHDLASFEATRICSLQDLQGANFSKSKVVQTGTFHENRDSDYLRDVIQSMGGVVRYEKIVPDEDDLVDQDP